MDDYEILEDLRYTKEHEWSRQEPDRIVVGISDYAQRELGDIVFVELPAVGSTVEKGEVFGVVESVKAVSDLYAPIGGEVVELNADLADRPEAVNEDCYGDGWLIAIVPDDPEDLETLLDAKAYREHLAALKG